jgi:hypothetical protein
VACVGMARSTHTHIYMYLCMVFMYVYSVCPVFLADKSRHTVMYSAHIDVFIYGSGHPYMLCFCVQHV